jgi:hypothetical protein
MLLFQALSSKPFNMGFIGSTCSALPPRCRSGSAALGLGPGPGPGARRPAPAATPAGCPAAGCPPRDCCRRTRAQCQGLTLVHSSAQRKHFLWDTLYGDQVSVTEMAQDGLKSGQVEAPAQNRSTSLSWYCAPQEVCRRRAPGPYTRPLFGST